MDPLSQLFAHPRAERAFSLLMTMRPPWAVDIADGSALTLMAVTRGGCRVEAGPVAHDLHPGDLALVRGPLPYRVGDRAGRSRWRASNRGSGASPPTGGRCT